jgi:aldose 1-epimerase
MTAFAADRHVLHAGAYAATFLPAHGMLCASLRHRDVETLRCIDDLPAAATAGDSAGVPLLHPWANRLSAWHYRAAGHDVVLDRASPLLHADWHDLPIHGVPWSRLSWTPIAAVQDSLSAQLDWTAPELLEVFPYPHTLRMDAVLDDGGLTITTVLQAHAAGPVPVSFGFHPYVGLPDLPRRQWRLILPRMQRLQLDDQLIPTGRSDVFPAMDGPLGTLEFDDGFAIDGDSATLAIAGGGRCVAISFLRGYDHAQIYAPLDRDIIALEPMTAPTNALVTGAGLRLVPAGGRFEAAFRISVDA